MNGVAALLFYLKAWAKVSKVHRKYERENLRFILRRCLVVVARRVVKVPAGKGDVRAFGKWDLFEKIQNPKSDLDLVAASLLF